MELACLRFPALDTVSTTHHQDLTKIQAEITEFRAQTSNVQIRSQCSSYFLQELNEICVFGFESQDDLQETPDSLDKLSHRLVFKLQTQSVFHPSILPGNSS